VRKDQKCRSISLDSKPEITLARSGTTQKEGQDKSDKSGRPEIPHIKQPKESLEAKLKNERNPIKRFFEMLGPGLITGTSDDDPSGIGTYAIVWF
jgi:hypothetical protein